MVNFIKIVALLASVGLANAQPALLAEPLELWANQILPTAAGASAGVFDGNGVKLTPDGRSLIATSVGGTVSSFNAFTGAFEWEYNPTPPSVGSVSSHSQVVFTTANSEAGAYMVYTVIENEFDATAVSRVISLDMAGNPLWVSDSLDGIAIGSPVISDDGNFVFLTHNAEVNTVGFFSSLWVPGGGSVFLSQSNATSPFAPLGIYHSPIQGNYDGDEGVGNTNDMIMWSQAPHPADVTVAPGYLFGFQFPIDFDPTLSANVSYFLLGNETRDFRASTAPIMTNMGLSGYFSASRSSFWGWLGNADNGRGRFSRPPNTGVAGFSRNPEDPGEPVFATPALTSDQLAPILFSGTAAAEFVRLSSDFSVKDVFTTTDLIKAGACVDPFDRVAYFVEVSGLIHQMPVTGTLSPIWSFSNLTVAVEGDMALNSNGWILYVADTSGFITALQVSEAPVTVAPTVAPAVVTSAPTVAPVFAPVVSTATPTLGANDTAPETDAPTVAPQVAPTEVPATTEAPASSAAQPMFFAVIASVALSLFL